MKKTERDEKVRGNRRKMCDKNPERIKERDKQIKKEWIRKTERGRKERIKMDKKCEREEEKRLCVKERNSKIREGEWLHILNEWEWQVNYLKNAEGKKDVSVFIFLQLKINN